jgi:hypothetical protein
LATKNDLFITKNSKYYSGVEKTGLFLIGESTEASVTTSNRNISVQSITYFDSNLKKNTGNFYELSSTVDSVNYRYWAEYTESGTSEVGE